MTEIQKLCGILLKRPCLVRNRTYSSPLCFRDDEIDDVSHPSRDKAARCVGEANRKYASLSSK